MHCTVSLVSSLTVMERGLFAGFFPNNFLKIDFLLLPESNRLLMEGALPPSPEVGGALLGLEGRILCAGVDSTD